MLCVVENDSGIRKKFIRMGAIGMTKKKYIHMIIMVALTFVIAAAPTIGGITKLGMQTLGVFIGVLYGWIAFDLTFPSIFGYVMLSVFGIMDATTALSSGFGNSNLVVLLAAMVFTCAIDSIGVTGVIANWLITREIFRKSPWLMVSGVIFSAYVLGMAGVHLAAIFLLWAVIMQIARENDIPKGDRLITFMIMMVTAAGFFGVFSVPFRATAMIFESYFINAMNMTFPMVPFIVFAVVMSSILLISMILIGKYVFRLDASQFIMADNIVEELKKEKASPEAKLGLVLLVAYAFLLIIPSLVPSLPGAKTLLRLGVGGLSLVGMLILAATSFHDKPTIRLSQTWTKGVDWQLILLLSVTFPIAEAMRAEEAGIMVTVMKTVLPIISSMSVTSFMIISMLLLGIITQFTHNIVLAAMFTQFLCPLCVKIGGNPYVMWFMMYFALNASYMTPAASFQSAMVHGHEAINVKYAYIFGIAISVIIWLALIVVGIPLGNMLFKLP